MLSPFTATRAISSRRAGRGELMRRILLEIPALGVKVPSFGFALLLACFGALFLAAWRARREKINPDTVFELALWLMSGGFIGARALYIYAHPESVRSLSDVVRFWQGGIVFYGCIIGGLIGSTVYWWRSRFPFRAMADAVAPSLALGCAIGRVGCFLNGCCYGAESHLPWAVRFPAGTLAWARQVQEGLIPPGASASLPLHPTQLYAVLDGVVLLALLSIFYPRRRRDGEVMALLMVTYPVTRFLIEGLRNDEPAFVAGLTLSQAISVVLFGGGVAFWTYLVRQPRVRFVDGAGKIAPPPPHFASRGIRLDSLSGLGVPSDTGRSLEGVVAEASTRFQGHTP
jgi:phosphatidylglycerol:prolipoprotein diacylglycerol transferase